MSACLFEGCYVVPQIVADQFGSQQGLQSISCNVFGERSPACSARVHPYAPTATTAPRVGERPTTRLHPRKPAREHREQIRQTRPLRLDNLDTDHAGPTTPPARGRDTGLQYSPV